MYVSQMMRGKIGQRYVKRVLEARGNKVYDMSDDIEYRHKDIDFIVETPDGTVATMEVKADGRAAATGNIYIQCANANTYNHHNQGWLYYCQADYITFAIVEADLILIAALSQVRALVEGGGYDIKENYDKTAWGYLLPMYDLEKLPSFQKIRSSDNNVG